MPKNTSSAFAPRFQGSTFEHMVEIFTGNFGPFDASPTGPTRNFLWKADARSDGTLTLITGQYSAAWHVRTIPETSEWLSILVPHTGSIDVRLGRSTIEGLPGRILLVNNHEAEHFFVRGEPHLSDVLRVDWTVIARTVAAILEIPLTGALGLAPAVDLSSPSGQLIGSLVQTIIIGMRDNGPLLHSPIAMSHLTQTLADLVVRSIPHRFSALLDKKIIMIAPRHVRRAIDFMNSNISRPITMQMVAEVAGVSIRSLETGFRAFKQTTPAVYLRTMRMRAVRQELLDPLSQQSVSEICLKWGFFHFGRFSATYRALYGENPSDTRKQSVAV